MKKKGRVEGKLERDAFPLSHDISSLSMSGYTSERDPGSETGSPPSSSGATGSSQWSNSSISYRRLDHNGSSTITTQSSPISERSGLCSQTSVNSASTIHQMTLLQDQKLRKMRRVLHLNLPSGKSTPAWERLAVTLCDQIEDWEEECRDDFEPPYYDCCVVHTQDKLDMTIAKKFLRALSLEGLKAISIMDASMGENRLDYALKLINGSTKVFVLQSPLLRQPGMHRLCFQEVIMRKLKEPSWKRKLVPLHPSDAQIKQYIEEHPNLSFSTRGELGLSTLVGIEIDQDYMMEKIRKCITMDKQISVMNKRKRAKDDFEYFIGRRKISLYEDVRNVIMKMRERFGDEDPSPFLTPICNELNNSRSLHGEFDQQINMSNCRKISVGPTFHFSINRSSDDDSS